MFSNSFNRNVCIYIQLIAFLSIVLLASCNKDDDNVNVSSGGNQTGGTMGQPGAGGVDQENEPFSSVIIGSQEWMSENLSVATYSDGTPIPYVCCLSNWYVSTGAWCWYNDDSATYAATYGRLYNWYAVAGIYNTASLVYPSIRKKLAPAGWHVANDGDWSTLINFLDPTADGGNNTPNNAGGKMKTTGTIQENTGLWNSPNSSATNASGFSGAPAGLRSEINSSGWNGVGNFTYWWSPSGNDSQGGMAVARRLSNEHGDAVRTSGAPKNNGFSVRCIRD